MMIVLRPPQTLPLLSAPKISHKPCVEVGDAAPGVSERVLSEVAPEVEIDPLEVVSRIVRHEHDGHPGGQPLQELAKRVFDCALENRLEQTPLPPASSAGKTSRAPA